MGSTVSIILRIRNSTRNDITSLTVYDVDSFDFGYKLRPDYIFNGMSIPAGRCIENMLEINYMASNCPFAMEISFKNGTVDVFKINSKCAFDNTEPNLRHLTKTHCISYKRPGPRILEIEVQHTAEQKENQKAEKLNEEGSVLMNVGKYEEASIKFLEAMQKANQESTKTAIKKNRHKLDAVKGNDIDKKAEKVNEEGLHLFNENKYQQAIKKFEEALRIARNHDTIRSIGNNLKNALEAKDNQEAKMLNQEGLLLRKSDQNDRAVMKFDEALRIALDSTLINSIKNNKAEILCNEALAAFNDAWFAETSLNDRTDEAIHKFAKAKFLFQEADSIKSDPKYKRFIELIDVKIEGTKYFSIALQLETSGSHLVDKTIKSVSSEDCEIAREKYKEACKHYKKAKTKFEEGLQKGEDNFRFSLEMTDAALNGVEKILNELEKAEVEITLNEEIKQ